MPSLTSALLILALLLVAYGLLAMADAAFGAARQGRLRRLAKEGGAGAARALQISEEPSRFLSVVLSWRLVLGMAAGILGAFALTGRLAAWIKDLGAVAPASGPVAFGVVVAGLSAIFMLFGELLPRRAGLAYPEKVASLLAGWVRLLSWFAGPFLRVAEVAAATLASLARVRARPAADSVGQDEVRELVESGMQAGVFQPVEVKMVEGVLTLDELRVTSLMTPRPRIVFLTLDDPEEVNWRKIVTSGHSYFPVYQGNRDQILGLVAVKALWAHSAIGLPTNLKNLLVPALFVPETMTAMQMLEQFKKTGRHIAVVVDEFGAVQGMVTLIDVFEAIVGDLPERGRRGQPEARKGEDGLWLVDAALTTGELKALIGIDTSIPGEGDAAYRTVGGFLATQFGRIPAVGDRLEWLGWIFEVTEMDRRRVDKVAVRPASARDASPSGPPAP